ncbi:alpha/beta hydrolase family protein [Pantoea eucalypti]|uniref:alpha/beta hydrolase family protein n=1 Tax=Pantoea eucalypti TaxID=470933 RepID=UPI003FA4C7CB
MLFRAAFIALSVLIISLQAHATPGFRQVTLKGDQGVPLNVAVWYPAAVQKGVSETVGGNAAFVGTDIIRDAVPASGKHPLLLISHGFNGSWRNLSWLASAMAAQGYIVAAPDHPGTTTFNHNPEDARKLWRRPGEISRVIDFVSQSSELTGTADPARIAAAGHSLGGWTVMSLAGARFDPLRLLHDCQRHVLRGDCKLITRLGIDDASARNVFLSDWQDKRIKAVVSLDAGLAPGFTPVSLSKINIPVLILAAGNGMMGELPAPEESEYLANQMRVSLRKYILIKGATHFSFMQICKPGAEKIIDDESPGDGIVCHDDKDADRTALHQTITTEITVFLNSVLNYQAPAGEINAEKVLKAAETHD